MIRLPTSRMSSSCELQPCSGVRNSWLTCETKCSLALSASSARCRRSDPTTMAPTEAANWRSVGSCGWRQRGQASDLPTQGHERRTKENHFSPLVMTTRITGLPSESSTGTTNDAPASAAGTMRRRMNAWAPMDDVSGVSLASYGGSSISRMSGGQMNEARGHTL